MKCAMLEQFSAAADRPVRRGASGPPCFTQMSTVDVINRWPRPSPVYHTDYRPKFTAPETISRSRDMVGGLRNWNSSRDLTTPFQGWFAIHGLALATVNLFTKFEISISTHYEDMKGDTICLNWGNFG